jgi:hypothetical protein
MTAFGLSFALAALAMFALNWLALIPWRNSGGELSWTDRAALLYPARTSAALNLWLVAASLACACKVATPGSPPLAAGIGGFLGAVAGSYPMARAIHRDLTFRLWLQVVAGQLILGALGLAVLAGFALAMPAAFGWRTWLLLLLYLLVHVALQLGIG